MQYEKYPKTASGRFFLCPRTSPEPAFLNKLSKEKLPLYVDNTQASDYNLRIILFFGENNEHQGSAKKIVRLRRIFTEK